MSKEDVPSRIEIPRAITGSGGVAPNYAAMTARDVETRAGGVAPNYAVSAEATPPEPVEVIEAPGATDPK